MYEGVKSVDYIFSRMQDRQNRDLESPETAKLKSMIENPPCGTACCIAGAAYVIDKDIVLHHTSKGWIEVQQYLETCYPQLTEKLFYVAGVHSSMSTSDTWPEFYGRMYRDAKTPLERAIAGVARIEHFIQTDGQE